MAKSIALPADASQATVCPAAFNRLLGFEHLLKLVIVEGSAGAAARNS
jgi:hypothetical protein